MQTTLLGGSYQKPSPISRKSLTSMKIIIMTAVLFVVVSTAIATEIIQKREIYKSDTYGLYVTEYTTFVDGEVTGKRIFFLAKITKTSI